jgi:hypothetical protein
VDDPFSLGVATRKRILFLSDNLLPEGNAPATRLYEHAIRWVRSGHEVTVMTCAPNFPEGRLFPGYRNAWRQVETVDGIRVVRVKTYITANEGFLKRTLDYLSFMLMGFAMALFERIRTADAWPPKPFIIKRLAVHLRHRRCRASKAVVVLAARAAFCA